MSADFPLRFPSSSQTFPSLIHGMSRRSGTSTSAFGSDPLAAASRSETPTGRTETGACAANATSSSMFVTGRPRRTDLSVTVDHSSRIPLTLGQILTPSTDVPIAPGIISSPKVHADVIARDAAACSVTGITIADTPRSTASSIMTAIASATSPFPQYPSPRNDAADRILSVIRSTDSPTRSNELESAVQMQKTKTFRIAAKGFFLTYPKCDDKEGCFNFLTDAGQKVVPCYVKVSLESHKDGTKHLHALVQYNAIRNISSARSFDFNNFHANVGKLIDAESADKYISKEDSDPLTKGILQLRVSNNTSDGKKPNRDIIMHGLYETASTKEEFLSAVRANMAYTYFTNYDRLVSSANSVFKAAVKEYVDPYPGHPWVLPGIVKKWLREEFPKPERAKALCLIGPTRWAKTTWARSLGRHIFWRSSTNLDTWDEEAKYIIIDDIDWKYLPNKKCWLTAMGDNTVTDRYRSKRDITNYKPCIYLCNPDQDPRNHFEAGEAEYWEGNMMFCVLSKSLIFSNAPIFSAGASVEDE